MYLYLGTRAIPTDDSPSRQLEIASRLPKIVDLLNDLGDDLTNNVDIICTKPEVGKSAIGMGVGGTCTAMKTDTDNKD